MDILPTSFENEQGQQKTPFLLLWTIQPRSFWASRHSQTPPSGPVAELSVRWRQAVLPHWSWSEKGPVSLATFSAANSASVQWVYLEDPGRATNHTQSLGK